MKTFSIIVLCFAFLLASCVNLPAGYPDDFRLVLEWNTGALPPQYRYQYSVTIGADLQGEFAYHPGYEEESEYKWKKTFNISESQLQSLYTYLRYNNLMRKKWQTGKALIGGQGTSIIITALGVEYQVPSISEIDRSDRELVERTIEEIRMIVPAQIWSEMEARQADYAEKFSD